LFINEEFSPQYEIREQLRVILLDGKNKIIDLNIVSTGTISSAPAWPREIVKPAILANAAAIILFHNHPSGDVAPSREDEPMTLRAWALTRTDPPLLIRMSPPELQ
jgi:DNA repair protein RadC